MANEKHKLARRARIEARRVKVAELLLAGMSEAEIAREVRVSQPTVSRDAAEIRAEWAAKRDAFAEAKAAADFARTDAVMRARWQRFLSGSPRDFDNFIAVLTYRAKVTGTLDRKDTGDVGAELF